ncbi:MAG: 4,5-DOPA dioxygenase extradiol [Bdellovibrionia bacterium]
MQNSQSSSDSAQKMPVVFVGHGSPMNAIANNSYTQMLEKLAAEIPTPKAILAVSAHWMTRGTWITAMQAPKTIHDFYGFPEALFQVQYPAPGNPDLAKSISELIQVPKIEKDQDSWGLDHGTWAVLKHMYPQANIPVLQLSLDMTQVPEFHFALGKKLAILREQGVLILGSGNLIHNLRILNWDEKAAPFVWAQDFSNWLKDKLNKKDFLPLVKDFHDVEGGKLSIPTLEHYLPALYVLGAFQENEEVQIDFDEIQNSSISMLSFRSR